MGFLTWFLVIVGILSVLALSGVGLFFLFRPKAPTPTPTPTPGGKCFSTADCDTGQICNKTVCTAPECSNDSDCFKFGKGCYAGRCASYFCRNTDDCNKVKTITGSSVNLTCQTDQNYCVPDTCSSDDFCPTGMKCQSNKCVLDDMGYTNHDPAHGCEVYDAKNPPPPGYTHPPGYACVKYAWAPFGCYDDSDCPAGKSCITGSCVGTDIVCQQGTYDNWRSNPGTMTTSCSTACPGVPAGLNYTSNYYIFINNQSSDVIYLGHWWDKNNSTSQMISPADNLMLNPKDTKFFTIPGAGSLMSGRIWMRTGCVASGSSLTCKTGDCANKLDCAAANVTGAGGVALFEFSFPGDGTMFGDISYVDGVNKSLVFETVPGTASGSSCITSGCHMNLKDCCPTESQVKDGENVIQCNNTTQLSDPVYRCPGIGADGNPIAGNSAVDCLPSKQPLNYPILFGTTCPQVNYYTFNYDDRRGTIICEKSGSNLPSFYVTVFDM